MAYYKLMSFDKSNEKTAFKVNLADVTPANFDAVSTTLLAEFIGLVEGLSLIEWKDVDLVSEEYGEVGSLPSEPHAQRELKARFEYAAAGNGRKGTVSVPAPDMDDVAQAGSDAINLADIEVAAYVAALETYSVSRDGAGVTVTGGRVVGRNI